MLNCSQRRWTASLSHTEQPAFSCATWKAWKTFRWTKKCSNLCDFIFDRVLWLLEAKLYPPQEWTVAQQATYWIIVPVAWAAHAARHLSPAVRPRCWSIATNQLCPKRSRQILRARQLKELLKEQMWMFQVQCQVELQLQKWSPVWSQVLPCPCLRVKRI